MPKTLRACCVLITCLTMAACETQANKRRGVMLDNPFRNDSSVIVKTNPAGPTPMQLCSSASLAEERTTTQKIVNGAQESATISGQTDLRGKLKAYSAEFEIAHRSMVRSCQLYASCMDKNGGDESRCIRSETRLAEAENSYYELIRQRDRLVAQVQVSRPVVIKQDDSCTKNKKCGQTESRCKSECDTTANIFTDDCCASKD